MKACRQGHAAERVAANLTEALIDLGKDVTLFVSGDPMTTADLVPRVPTGLRPDTRSAIPFEVTSR